MKWSFQRITSQISSVKRFFRFLSIYFIKKNVNNNDRIQAGPHTSEVKDLFLIEHLLFVLGMIVRNYQYFGRAIRTGPQTVSLTSLLFSGRYALTIRTRCAWTSYAITNCKQNSSKLENGLIKWYYGREPFYFASLSFHVALFFAMCECFLLIKMFFSIAVIWICRTEFTIVSRRFICRHLSQLGNNTRYVIRKDE